MKMFDIRCPCCNENIKLQLNDNNEIEVISHNDISEMELSELLNEMNIEFG